MARILKTVVGNFSNPYWLLFSSQDMAGSTTSRKHLPLKHKEVFMYQPHFLSRDMLNKTILLVLRVRCSTVLEPNVSRTGHCTSQFYF